MSKIDIIEPVDKPTEWVSAIVPVEKQNGKIRITNDGRAANKAIERVKYAMPTTEEIAYDLNGSSVFSKIDLNKAFHQLE
jgi:hypothetical protein